MVTTLVSRSYTDLDIVDEERRFVAESPLWDYRANRLYWVDVARPAILWRDMNTGNRHTWSYDEEVGSIALCEAGGLVAGMRSGIYRVDTETGMRTPLAKPESDRPLNRFNDGAVDPTGRYWIGSLQTDSLAPRGRLWRIEADACGSAMLDGLTCPNGLCWSPDGQRMYFTDSSTQRIDVFDYDVCDGVAYNRRLFAELPDGRGVGDGATVDGDGYLWSASCGGWCITRYDPRGRVDRIVGLPVRLPTSCCFGGQKLDTLYITSSTRMGDVELAQQPMAGRLIAAYVGVKGVCERTFVLNTQSI
ncbi:SMP-30/gluconolactonase/LRE family protein [Paraburkholderia sartisoli]|uniref:Sugar lactone lactonase YvrE n=1 Tax=Paraburkholderia sartisoli TaxID=83784 RepID=A0A1H4GSV3_9BURK|nr:SMP-30/gluconolactonase/LRE family protein [Paraburkholderia sartisoli]SEB12130.1 Sugar lactone lactonase YvrE [Paraburkholderia sartisoli]